MSTVATNIGDYNIGDSFSDLLLSLLGGEKRKVILSGTEDRLILPVTPWKFSVTTGQNNKIVDIIDSGEYLLFGNAKLKRLKLECFFPRMYHGYPFVVGDKKEPDECIDQIIKWKESKEPVRVIITDSSVNLMMAIMEFKHYEKTVRAMFIITLTSLSIEI